jgi:hypothetical protein
MQPGERVFHVHTIANFEHKLLNSPRPLLLRPNEPLVNSRLNNSKDFSRLQRRISLYGKVPPFLAAAPGGSNRAGAN